MPQGGVSLGVGVCKMSRAELRTKCSLMRDARGPGAMGRAGGKSTGREKIEEEGENRGVGW